MDINVGTTAPAATRMMSLGKSMLDAVTDTDSLEKGDSIKELT
jgi:hypothetical protein